VLLLDGSHKGARTRLPAVARAAPRHAQPPQPVRPQSVPFQSPPPQVAAAAIAPEGFGFYAALKRDTSEISRNAVGLIDHLTLTRSPKAWDTPIAMLLLVVPISFISFLLMMGGWKVIGSVWFLAGVAVSIVLTTYVLLSRARIYELREGLLRITRGILSKKTDSYELFRVIGVRVDRGLIQRMVNSGTLTLTIERPGGASKDLQLVGLAPGRELLRLQDDLRNLSQLLRQNPLVKGIIT
jgi:membrane protein YdbS with pleckstrin-like domain